jgi:hypothetical protein
VENAGFHRDGRYILLSKVDRWTWPPIGFPNQQYQGILDRLFCTSMCVMTLSQYL